jgi:hypothetical protein
LTLVVWKKHRSESFLNLISKSKGQNAADKTTTQTEEAQKLLHEKLEARNRRRTFREILETAKTDKWQTAVPQTKAQETAEITNEARTTTTKPGETNSETQTWKPRTFSDFRRGPALESRREEDHR